MAMNDAVRWSVCVAVCVALGACGDNYFPATQNSVDMPAGVDIPEDVDSPEDVDIPEDVDMPTDVDMEPVDMQPEADMPPGVDMEPDADMPPDVDMPPPDPCQGVSCGANGQCAPVNGAATCACDMGFVPQGLSCVAAPIEATIVANVTSAATTTEAGGQATLTVQLSRQPTHAVTIPLKLSRPDLATANLSEVLFIPASWNVPQTITITGEDDGTMNGQQTYFVLLGPAVSQDADFMGLEADAMLTSEDTRCGDGLKASNEQCDEPGASQQCAYGQSSCTVCTPQCTLIAGQPGQRCGDGVKNGPEQCDEPGASQRCAYGQSSCMVCTPQCALTAGQPGLRCGDGVKNGPEQCDEPGASQQCAYGQSSCTVCNAQCAQVAGQPGQRCGDATVQAAQGEQCDGSAGGAMCPAGSSGAVSCDAMCQLDSSGCLLDAAMLWMGHDHTCITSSAGQVLCWGDNTSRAISTSSAATISTPTPYPGLPSGLASVALGRAHTCVETATGGVKCWGSNTYGQLGDGSQTSRTSPVDVLTLSNIRALSAGDYSTCAVNSVGGAVCWGNNSFGQLGTSSSSLSTTPAQVAGLTSGVTFVAAGSNHACARMTSGGVKCWGYNHSGQLGNDDNSERSSPVDVVGLTNARFITVGLHHSCAITSANTVKCWGHNSYGQLGDGTTTGRSSPVDVLGLSDVKTIAAGSYYTCALTNAGAIKCWGSNTYGQLGDGTATQRTMPVTVTGMSSGARALFSGNDHVCAQRTTGELRCWGRNNRDQLADPSVAIKLVPSAIPGVR